VQASVWEYAVTVLSAVIGAVAGGADGSDRVSPVYGGVAGLLVGALFCTFSRLVSYPLQREVESLRDRVAELERRSGTGA